MASRQNYPSVLSSQTSSNSSQTASAKEKSSHSKTETSKLKHDKSSSSSSSSGHIPLSSNTIINNMSKRKGTSFQITSVSVSSANSHHSQQVQRNSTDNNNGDDSADDLDDSHTDDNISRITDYETPSISETFSGEDVFFAQQNAFGTAPVIPTSSQYGLAIVGPDLGGNGTNLSDVHVSVSDAGINIMGPISSKQDPDHKNERFKVVKIESTEPFKRGRWMCMDYLDHTTLQDDGIDGKDGDETKDEYRHGGIVGPRVLIMNNGEIEHIISDNEELDHEVNKINSKQHQLYNHQQHDVTQNSHQNTSHPQTLTSIPTYIDHSSSTTNIVHNQTSQTTQSMPQRQLEQILTQEKQLTLNLSHDNTNSTEHHAGMATNGPQSELLPQSSNENFVSNNNISNNTSQQQSIGNQQQQHFIEHHQHAQTMTQEMIHSMVHHQDQQNHLQGSTLPTNILMQNISHDHQQQQSQLNSPNSSNALPLSSIPTQNININVTENASLNSAENEYSNNNSSNSNNQDNMTNQFQASQVVTGDRIQQQQCESDNQQQTGNLVTNEINLSNNNNSDSNNNITVSNDGTQQNVSSPSSSAGLGTVAEGGAAGINNLNDISESASNSVNSGNNNSNATVGGIDDGQAISEDNERDKLSHDKNMSRKNDEHRPHYLPHQHILDKQKMIERSVKCTDINGILTMISGNNNKRNSNENSSMRKKLAEKTILDAEHTIIYTNIEMKKVGNSKSNNTNLLLFGQYSKTTAPSMIQKAKEKKCIGCTPGGLATTALTMNLSTISPLCTNVGCIGASCSKDANASSRVSRSASPALGNTSDNPSASGTSAVAIDNKIEQAMDLVKSHLMFAVREEVEVLKEKIAELMDRINQLEVENTILKANASQETLSQLTTAAPSPPQQQQQQQQQSASPVVSQNPPSQPQQISTPSQPQATQPSANTQNQAAS